MLIKIHKSYRDVIAICDSELLGKKLEQQRGKQGKTLQLDLTGNFFKGDEKTEQEIFNILKEAVKEDACFNIVGEKSIQTALKAGIISSDGIVKIQGIPVALSLL
jgi:hypothetical protein